MELDRENYEKHLEHLKARRDEVLIKISRWEEWTIKDRNHKDLNRIIEEINSRIMIGIEIPTIKDPKYIALEKELKEINKKIKDLDKYYDEMNEDCPEEERDR